MNKRYRLKPEEFKLVEQYRSMFNNASSSNSDTKSLIVQGWLRTKEGTIHVKNEMLDPEILIQDVVKQIESFSPIYPPIVREKITDGHLLVIDPADVHIGKICSSFETGEDYNSEIAVTRVLEGVRGLIQKSSAVRIDKIILVCGNDILHVDNPANTTTSGTRQDADGMWYDNFNKAKRLYIDILEMLIPIADVHVVYCPSNHDYMSGFMLMQVIEAWFKNNKNVTFDNTIAHRKYFGYGNNCIGFTHGDGAKTNDLPLLMAQETDHWSRSKRYIYTHHLHHKVAKDYGSVCVETLRSPSSTDSWHHKKGYQHAPKAIEAFIHHPVHGQVQRLTHYF